MYMTSTVLIGMLVFAFVIGIIAGRVASYQRCQEEIRHVRTARLCEALGLPCDENKGDC